jgi:hypothetical protein
MHGDEVGLIETKARLHEDGPAVIQRGKTIKDLPLANVQWRRQATEFVHVRKYLSHRPASCLEINRFARWSS